MLSHSTWVWLEIAILWPRLWKKLQVFLPKHKDCWLLKKKVRSDAKKYIELPERHLQIIFLVWLRSHNFDFVIK